MLVDLMQIINFDTSKIALFFIHDKSVLQTQITSICMQFARRHNLVYKYNRGSAANETSAIAVMHLNLNANADSRTY